MAKKTAKAKDKKKKGAKPAAAKKKTAKPAAKPAKKAAAKAAKASAKPAKKAAKGKVAPKAQAAKGKGAAPKAAKHAVEKPAKEKHGKKEKVAKGKVAEVENEELNAAAVGEEEESEEIVLTDAEGRRYCRVKDCDQLSSVDGYCRYHYLLYWKKIQIRKKILSEGKLDRYIEELTARYPDKFLDMLRKDLRSEKEFLSAIQELEIDESAVDSEFEDETQTYIDEVRGMGEPAAREEEDF
jgi:hypothetical protein